MVSRIFNAHEAVMRGCEQSPVEMLCRRSAGGDCVVLFYICRNPHETE